MRHVAAYVFGSCAVVATGIAVQQAAVIIAALLGMLTSEIIMYGATSKHVRVRHALLDGLVSAALAASSTSDAGIWQAPLIWSDVFAITAPAAAIAAMAYFVLCAYTALSAGYHVKLTVGFSLLAIPYLFNVLLILQSSGLRADIGRTVTIGATISPGALRWIGSAVVLIFVNEAIATLLFLVCAGRLVTDRRMHGLLVASALFASATPWIADLGSSPVLTRLPALVGHCAALSAATLSQAGLWAQTFLLTGMLMDALRGKHPVWYWNGAHFAEGLVKGALYTVIFFSIIYGGTGALGLEWLRDLASSHPLLFGACTGLVLFPFVKTIVESFDGSLPFFTRLHNNYARPDHWMRGSVVGMGIAWAVHADLSAQDSGARFLYGCLIGGLAYGAVNMLRDAVNVTLFNRRLRLRALNIYVIEFFMGGLAGGALGWYFDTLQTGVLVDKFQKYAALFYGASGIAIEDYVIYPLCSKWGAMNLGTVSGGVRLFYSESLSGVIAWSIAAPLFSINLVLLTALVQGSTKPLKNLFTRQGVVGMVEQAFRVQRWGLWMAPIIYSFLRISPTPTWYNQDGAVRTIFAVLKNITSSPEQFHAWSLATFTNILAHDWLRIAVYVDHMFLRVATLVNFSFVGMDMLDEKIARLYGHSFRTRVIPQGLRRFVTWAPLLIPFYLPRGSEWISAWTAAEKIAREHPAVLFPPELLAGAFGALACCTGAVMFTRTIRRTRLPQFSYRKPVLYEIGNGLYTLCMDSDGRGFSRVYSAVRRGSEFDLTRRPHDELQRRGKFIYVQDYNDPEIIWSLNREPVGTAGPDYSVRKVDRLTLEICNTWSEIRARAVVRIHPHAPREVWTIHLRNNGTKTRVLRVVSYREFALNVSDMYLRHPEYNNLHIGTWFVPGLNAIIACNRLLKRETRDPYARPISGEVAFHAVGETPGSTVLLTGYEDDRRFFIGGGTLRRPEMLMKSPRSLSDDGLLYTFDPAASLWLHVTLRPGAETSIVFVDGYASSIQETCDTLRAILRLPAAGQHSLEASLRKARVLHGFGAPDDRESKGTEPQNWSFSDDGTELHAGVETPRSWTHVIANRHGYGVVVNNHGEIFSFMGNSQQNGLTPFSLNLEPVEIPGQATYLYDIKTGRIESPTFAPLRKRPADCSVRYGRGYAVFQKSTEDKDLSLTLWVVPDEPAEVRLLRVHNKTKTDAVFRLVVYLQMVLGETAQDTRGLIRSEYDGDHQILFFTNPSNQFHRGWAFVGMGTVLESYATSRRRFLGGHERDFTNPFMVEHGVPDFSVPEDDYTAAALSGTFMVPADDEAFVPIIIGQAQTREEAIRIVTAYRDSHTARSAFDAAQAWWADLLSAVRVTTNNPGFDRLVNDWLPYQVYTAHLWGRVGPSQRSGGYGYRDQLQAALPLIYINPDIARSQILLHARQQFYASGDVLQWWHQSWEGKSGLGARNRASDPHLWLPYLVYNYVQATGDMSILEEEIEFLERRRIPRDRDGVMFAPRPSLEKADLYVHCIKAIDLTLSRLGPHGLPLIGTGDWNDGLSLIGVKGRGESVWLGFFLYDIIMGYAPLIQAREGKNRHDQYLKKAAKLRQSLERMWRDGRYVRAITDDGREMVFADAINAAWSAISGAADYGRAVQAVLHGLDELEKEDLVLLLTPPFTEKSEPYPGKIADYPPGVRENGGQYSHGVSWFVDALVRLADQARKRGDLARAREFQQRAYEVWCKISPLGHTAPQRMPRYGLPPHQQAADVYYGYGYEGRGGWSWYTGAAARMLFAAYQLLGLTMQKGIGGAGKDLFEPKGDLIVRSLVYKGTRYTAQENRKTSR